MKLCAICVITKVCAFKEDTMMNVILICSHNVKNIFEMHDKDVDEEYAITRNCMFCNLRMAESFSVPY